MYSRSTTTVDILRGTSQDDYGDDIDNDNVVASGRPASIIEQKGYSQPEVTTQPRNFRYARCRMNSNEDVRTNDRIRDNRTGWIWTITNVSGLQNPFISQDLRIDLMHVG